ncbi:hypothetical protein [uncultured Gemella sp.]|mgnify:FL=1|uniref:hypothetical protein n=1 Tax=uncultured Gemella sp. TaxID=254352 RepID=UPI0028D59F1D|nr:hypothetical protein [uncultured Gemella sp.]
MNSLIFIFVMFILSLVFDKLKQAKVKNEEIPKKKKKVKISTNKVSSNNPRIKEEPLERKPRVIVDREKEIVSNTLTFDKERILNDIIFSEVLSKPKSKR